MRSRRRGRLPLDRRGEGPRPLRRPDVSALRAARARRSAGPAVLGVAAAPDGSLWARLRGSASSAFATARSRTCWRRSGAPRIGRHGDGARRATARARGHASVMGPWPIATAASTPIVTRDAAELVVRDLDGGDQGRRRSGSARATPASCASQGRTSRTLTRRAAGPEGQLSACRRERRAVDRHGSGVVRWTGTESRRRAFRRRCDICRRWR